MDELKELLQFLNIGARLDLKAMATRHILDFTGNTETLNSIINSSDILLSLLQLTHDTNETIAKDAILSLVNISANDNGAKQLLNLEIDKNKTSLLKAPQNIIIICLNFINNPESTLADPSCMVLSNITRSIILIDKVIDLILKSNLSVDHLVNIFTKNNFNKKGAKLHYLGPFFSNLTQSPQIRKFLLDKNKCIIQRLLPFTEYQDSIIRRGGIVATLKNCCFEEDYHSWLLSKEVDILPRLLLPLAGPEEFDEEDNDKLPDELQYLPETKTREPDPDIRIMLMEAVIQLCARRHNREYIRNKNTYIILRELHKWEKDKKALIACENLVDILIRTEDEIGEDNLKKLEIPEDLKSKFEKMDQNV